MRVVLGVLMLGFCTSAAAQPALQLQLDELRAQQEAAQRRSIDQSNQLQALDARLRADDASATLAAQRAGVRAPTLPYADPMPRGAAAATRNYPSMSDAALAESNKRVQDAARNRR